MYTWLYVDEDGDFVANPSTTPEPDAFTFPLLRCETPRKLPRPLTSRDGEPGSATEESFSPTPVITSWTLSVRRLRSLVGFPESHSLL